MFERATSFNQDVSSFNTSSVTDIRYMFKGASSFNQDLCAWQDRFPYNDDEETEDLSILSGRAADIFFNSSCTYQDTPQASQKGPFCASDCQSSQVTTTSTTLPT